MGQLAFLGRPDSPLLRSTEVIGSLSSIVFDIRITRYLMTTPSRVENTQLRIRGSCLTDLKRSETAPVINCKIPAANAKDMHEYM